MTDRLRILVSGTLAGVPDQGGAQWAILQYVLGLRRLGHDVWFVEPDRSGEDAIGRAFTSIVRAFGLEDRATLLAKGGSLGVPPNVLRRAADGADLLLNISGVLRDDDLVAAPRRRAYVDLDPAFTQLWHDVEGIDMGLERHERHVTVGLAIGDASCDVPTAGVEWITTAQPVVLDEWPVGDDIVHDGLTTVGNWRGYGSVEWRGTKYGQRAHSFRTVMGLPRLTDERLLPALSIHPDERADLDALAELGWTVLNPADVASTPETYRAFVRGSKGELGIAKSGYLLSRCGWFSDRSACFLAAGRPVVAQETGFSRFLPTGEGLLAFGTAEEAAGRIDELNARYDEHRKAARALAEDVFDSDRVLTRLIERLGAGA